MFFDWSLTRFGKIKKKRHSYGEKAIVNIGYNHSEHNIKYIISNKKHIYHLNYFVLWSSPPLHNKADNVHLTALLLHQRQVHEKLHFHQYYEVTDCHSAATFTSNYSRLDTGSSD